MKKYIVSIDFGGTKVLSALTDESNQIISKIKIATDVSKGVDILLNSIANSVLNLMTQTAISKDEIKAIVIGVPGAVNPFTGIVGNAPNLGLTNINIKEEIEKRINIPVLIENDVNLGAIGILGKELKEDAKNVLVVFIGTGIGGALIFDRKIYRGSNYFAGEIGHMKISGEKDICGCGAKGCFEAVASRTAMARDILKELKRGQKSSITKVLTENKKIKSKALKFALKEKDPLVTKIVKDKSIIIGKQLGSITNLLNVDTIVLGGGVTEALGKYIVPWIKKGFKETVLEDLKTVDIFATELGDDAAIYAGYYLYDEMKDLIK